LFCEFYALTKNASESAKKAGYSEKTAGVMGYENLKKPQIQAYLNQLYSEAIGNSPEGSIATIKEILQFHTKVMKGQEEGATITERQRSANSLYEMLIKDEDSDDEESGVIILPEVKNE
jgi:phage terminase small subunit